MKSSLVAFLLLATQSGSSLPMMRPAPTKCPLENGNLLDVHLFISDEMACKQLCQDDEVTHLKVAWKKKGLDRC